MSRTTKLWFEVVGVYCYHFKLNSLKIIMHYSLGLEYDGSLFHGWQKQKNPPVSSIQQILEDALGKIANHDVHVIAAGRTDKGVHASNQIVHFDTSASRKDFSWIQGSNHYLPSDIQVQWIKKIDESFHARFSASARRYLYAIYCAKQASCLLAQQTVWLNKTLNLSAMIESTQYLLGEHDFSTFRGSDCQANSPIRTIHHLNIRQCLHLPIVIIDIKANAFLHHMVRNIVGCLIEIGAQKQDPIWMKTILEAKDRRAGAQTAPAKGLFFCGAEYPKTFLTVEQSIRFPWFYYLP